jgi:phage terminase large subunit-like protein
MAMLGLRLGRHPRWIVTTTPKPRKLIFELVHRAESGGNVVLTRGNTFENADNLAPSFLAQIKNQYEGTRLGRQELYAELLSDTPGALWNRDMLEKARHEGPIPDLVRIVVGVDPSATSGDDNGDSVGIVVCGVDRSGVGFVLADLTVKASPAQWGRVVVNAYHHYKADRIIAEKNQGGAMVEHVIRTVDPNVPYRASRGKVARAEPICALYESGRIKHCGNFTTLEDQFCAFTSAGYVGDSSPDAADACIWALTELMGQPVRPCAQYSTYSAWAPPIPGMSGTYSRMNPPSKMDGPITDGPLAGGFARSRR